MVKILNKMYNKIVAWMNAPIAAVPLPQCFF